ncbi:MAG: phosphoenolpyruvate--protein phosphotransferase [Fibrobacterales bacterium]
MSKVFKKRKRVLLYGVAASPGITMGPVHLLKTKVSTVEERTIEIGDVAFEISTFKYAVAKSIKELTTLKAQITQTLGAEESRIFSTHIMILQDSTLIDNVISIIRSEKKNAEFAYQTYMQTLIGMFEQKESEIAKEKVSDLRDVFNRVLSNFGSLDDDSDISVINQEAIVVSHELTPSQLTHLNRDFTLGFSTDIGGKNSHVAILARSMQLPAVSGLKNLSFMVRNGDYVIVDGVRGLVIINPDDNDIETYTERKNKLKKHDEDLHKEAGLDPITSDGKYINLYANVVQPIDAHDVQEYGANGVGLFRSEFLYFDQPNPSEDDQFYAYKHLLENMSPKPVTIRTLDSGGDKLVQDLNLTDEDNPVMGWRSIRVCLDQPEFFKIQLRALLRSSKFGNLKIMFPMISGLKELREAKRLLEEARQELRDAGTPFNESIPVGTMVEIPSAVELIHELSLEVDFVSIGTNDLIQFTLAVDRSNEKIKFLYDAFHPSVVRMIRKVVNACHKNGITVSVCGEMASDPYAVPLLLGMGVDELSMTANAILECKKVVRSISYSDSLELANRVLQLCTADEIHSTLYEELAEKFSQLGIVTTVEI